MSTMHLSQLILKVHDLCNLNCNYCYVYSDDSYVAAKQKSLSEETLRIRLEELLTRATLGKLSIDTGLEITLHGGEPTLLGLHRISGLINATREILQNAAPRLRISMTTNGVLFDDTWASYFADNPDLGLAISHDGPKEVHDQHRSTKASKGSHKAATSAIRTAIRYGIDPFILAVIDVDSDPREVLNYFQSLGVRRMDLLLPETLGGLRSGRPPPGALEYYLVEAYNHWSTTKCGFIRLRLFDTVLARLLGKETKNCTLGPGCASIITIHSDGDLSGCDVLGSKAAPGRVRSIGQLSWDEFAQALRGSTYGRSQAIVPSSPKPKPCEGCKYWQQCGGYCLATRIDKFGQEDLSQTTPHCGALYALFTAVETHLKRLMPDKAPTILPSHHRSYVIKPETHK